MRRIVALLVGTLAVGATVVAAPLASASPGSDCSYNLLDISSTGSPGTVSSSQSIDFWYELVPGTPTVEVRPLNGTVDLYVWRVQPGTTCTLWQTERATILDPAEITLTQFWSGDVSPYIIEVRYVSSLTVGTTAYVIRCTPDCSDTV